MILKNKVMLSSVIIMIISLFVGCGNNCINNMDKAYGDDNEISQTYNSFALNKSKQKTESGKYKGDLKLSGHGTIWEYKSNEDCELEAQYRLNVKSGKAKIVLISPDDTVTTLVENTGKASMDGTTSLKIPVKKGTNRIKLVGYGNANISIELNINKGRLEEIGF